LWGNKVRGTERWGGKKMKRKSLVGVAKGRRERRGGSKTGEKTGGGVQRRVT